MNYYTQKQLWKFLLLFVALLIVGGSLWYSSVLVSQIGKEEKKNVELWAEAVRKKAKLVQYTNVLFSKLREDERVRAKIVMDATKILANSDEDTDVGFPLEVASGNTTIPVILTDDKGRITYTRNLDDSITTDSLILQAEFEAMAKMYPPIKIPVYGGRFDYLYYKDSKLFTELQDVLDDLIESFISEVVINAASVPTIMTDELRKEALDFGNIDSVEFNTPERLATTLANMESQNEPIEIDLGNKRTLIFYSDSSVITQLRLYPIVQFVMIFIFILVAYFMFNSARRAEQNQVWVGMAKETAHQLGTPLSSLMAWIEYMRAKEMDEMVITELEKDTHRLETITDRFSKIGSTPKLEEVDIAEELVNAISYMQSRTSKNVQFFIEPPEKEGKVKLNIPLFGWVIENLCKNAVDAMSGNGEIHVTVKLLVSEVQIDITDTGKGIPTNKMKTVFEPGFTTKKRGWGLGLSLTKRIIEIYHKGKIFVKWSEVGKGTTFRILLRR